LERRTQPLYKIVKKEVFSPATFLWEVEAPDVARACQPGHFLMVLLDEHGERIPLTVADYDRKKGTVTVVIQAVGKSTREMLLLKEGESIKDFIGPLGEASHIEKKNKVILVGGGLGVAPVYPQLRAFKELGSYTISIIGFRAQELIFWEEEFGQHSDELHVCTDDGSYGFKGFVSVKLQEVLEEQDDVEEVVAIGPLPMMRACCDVTRPFEAKTMVSLNSIMVDGTGMCGSCRVTVGGEMKFACVDGPDFDGHEVDFDELMLRQRRFEREEIEALKHYEEECKLLEQKA
jgi:NAD(P)H-flavin reductase